MAAPHRGSQITSDSQAYLNDVQNAFYHRYDREKDDPQYGNRKQDPPPITRTYFALSISHSNRTYLHFDPPAPAEVVQVTQPDEVTEETEDLSTVNLFPDHIDIVEAEPVEAEPVEAEPVEAEPVEAEPVEAEPVEAEPVEAEPVEAEPVEAEPVDTSSAAIGKTNKPAQDFQPDTSGSGNNSVVLNWDTATAHADKPAQDFQPDTSGSGGNSDTADWGNVTAAQPNAANTDFVPVIYNAEPATTQQQADDRTPPPTAAYIKVPPFGMSGKESKHDPATDIIEEQSDAPPVRTRLDALKLELATKEKAARSRAREWSSGEPAQPEVKHVGWNQLSADLIFHPEDQERPRIDFKLKSNWVTEDEREHHMSVEFIFFFGNIKAKKIGEGPEGVFQIRRIRRVEELDAALYPGCDLESVRRHTVRGGGLVEATIKGISWENGGAEWSCRVDIPEEEFGPHYDVVVKFREALRRDHEIRILLFAANDNTDHLTTTLTKILECHHGCDPLNDFWRDVPYPVIMPKEILQEEYRKPGWSGKLMITYSDGAMQGITRDFFAGLGEIEFQERHRKSLENVHVRLILVPGSYGKCMLALVDTASIGMAKSIQQRAAEQNRDAGDTTHERIADEEVPFIGLSVGDQVLVTLPALNIEADGDFQFTGRVVKPSRFAQTTDVSIFLHSVTEVDEATGITHHREVDITAIQSSIIDLIDLTDADIAYKKFRDTPPTAANVHVVVDKSQRKRLFNNCEAFRKAMSEQFRSEDQKRKFTPGSLEKMYCLKALNQLQSVDIYQGVDQTCIDNLMHQLDTDELRDAVQYMRSAVNGVGLIRGFAGTGKTRLLTLLLQPLLQDAHENTGVRAFRALIASPINSNCDDICKVARHVLSAVKSEPQVYRAYVSTTEREIAELQRKHARPVLREGSYDREEFATYWEAVELMDITNAMMDYLDSLTSSETGVADARVTRAEFENSLGYQVNLQAGLLDDTEPEVQELREYAQMVAEYKDITIPWTNDKATALGAKWNAASCYVISQADVIVCTAALANDARIVDHFKATIIAVDEATKVCNSDMLGLLCKHPQRFTIMVGDPLQTTPVAKAGPAAYPFASQFPINWYSRALIGGWPYAELNQQSRFEPGLCRLVSEVFCRNRLVMHPHFDEGDEAFKSERDTLLRRLGSQSLHSLVVYKLNYSKEEFVGLHRTRINRDQVAFTWSLLEAQLLKPDSQFFRPEHVAVISIHTGQANLHINTRAAIIAELRAKNLLFAGFEPEELMKILITTVDTAQGGQRRLVIFNTVVSDSIGMLSERPRFLVGVSRARSILLLVHNHKMTLEKSCRIKHLAEVWKFATKHDCWLNINDHTFKYTKLVDKKDPRVVKAINFKFGHRNRDVDLFGGPTADDLSAIARRYEQPDGPPPEHPDHFSFQDATSSEPAFNQPPVLSKAEKAKLKKQRQKHNRKAKKLAALAQEEVHKEDEGVAAVSGDEDGDSQRSDEHDLDRTYDDMGGADDDAEVIKAMY